MEYDSAHSTASIESGSTSASTAMNILPKDGSNAAAARSACQGWPSSGRSSWMTNSMLQLAISWHATLLTEGMLQAPLRWLR